jgi:hypothetical protein
VHKGQFVSVSKLSVTMPGRRMVCPTQCSYGDVTKRKENELGLSSVPVTFLDF